MNEEVKVQVVELLEAGELPTKVRGFLTYMHNFKDKEARDFVNKVMDELGITRGSKVNLEEAVRTIRENYGTMPRKDLAKLVAERSGSTESTAGHMISAINFAKEWTLQEMS